MKGLMMLHWKSWRESRLRFLLLAIILIWISIDICRHGTLGERTRVASPFPLTYDAYVYREMQQRFHFIIAFIAILGLGGLQREQEHGTVGFTLALPAKRSEHGAARATVGLVQTSAIAMILPTFILMLSPWLAHEAFSVPLALRSAVLSLGDGAAFLAAALVLSTLYRSISLYILSWAVAGTMFQLTVMFSRPDWFFNADLKGGQGWVIGGHGELLLQPFPWIWLTIPLGLAAIGTATAIVIARRQEF